MKTVIVLIVALYFTSTHAADCSTNPCGIAGYFNETRGYRCLQVGASALCTCPGHKYTFDRPCRLCGNQNASEDACTNSNGNLILCLESDDCGTSFSCLCNDTAGNSVQTTNADCDLTKPLQCSSTTNPGTGPSPCLHGGVYSGGICHCPSGYGGAVCQNRDDHNLCERVTCKTGFCATQPPQGPHQAVCLCPYGTWGEYCEMKGTPGFCLSGLCLNNGACQENVIGSTRFAYCKCAPGFNGTKCESNYFSCASAGFFQDTYMHEQGKYFECRTVTGGLRAEERSCPKGLRFNATSRLCLI
ncbi:unnamed protein product [Adineta ricciae]|uniref:EGF-like domain-containing protein n=1 Tax=Adineta ricciae TaxID=249248 RepID=A0A813T747_ADIRI|nr:unnamed protein product [Adineta ricciae]CAF1419967.1 unnamed protein product [Adineta ricciae]